MKQLHFLLLYCLCSCIFVLAEENQKSLLPSYYEKILKSKIQNVKNADNGFVFFTDTHISANNLQTSNIVNYVLKNTLINTVIWGGDAISAFGGKEQLDEQWKIQREMFQSIRAYGKLYLVRGNHDLTIRRSKETSERFSYSQDETFDMFCESMEKDVVRNAEDPFGMYYYFDDLRNKIRYIVVESFSRTKIKKHRKGGFEKFSETQLDWIVNAALLTTPSGYGVVFVMHAPITDTTTGKDAEKFSDILNVINAASEKSYVLCNGKKYDFSLLKDVEILMVVAGHHHHDMQTYQHGVLHVITASDARYMDFKRDPFVLPDQNRRKENGQCVDVFFIDRISNTIKAVRVGVGGDRTFHLKPIEMNVGESKALTTELDLAKKWYSYNTSGNSFEKTGWTLMNDIVSVSNDGTVIGLREGSAVVLVQNELGNREIYNVIVK